MYKRGLRLILKYLPIVFAIGFGSCETNPVIYTDDLPAPVIYGVINSSDSVHYLKIGKTFGAKDDPLLSAKIYDSLYFDEAEIRVYKTQNKKPIAGPYPITLIEDQPKDEGIFSFPGQKIFSFEADLGRGPRGILVEVDVPGLPLAAGHVEIVSPSIIYTPKEAQQYIYLVPDSPWLIQFSGNKWNEIDVDFEFLEELSDNSLRSKSVHIQNTNYFDSPYEKYRELKITYDELIREMLLQIPVNDSVKRLFLGNISISVHSGDQNMVNYVKYLNGYNDLNSREFSNIENGIGLLASRAVFTKDSLDFDHATRNTLINERRLKVLKISKWDR